LPRHFDFDDHSILDPQVGPKNPNLDPFVIHPDFSLGRHPESSGPQLHLHSPLINFLQKPITQNIMHREGGPDHRLGNISVGKFHKEAV